MMKNLLQFEVSKGKNPNDRVRDYQRKIYQKVKQESEMQI